MNVMEALLVNGEYRHLGLVENMRIIECSDLYENDARGTWRLTDHMRPTVSAELTCDGVFKVATLESLGGSI